MPIVAKTDGRDNMPGEIVSAIMIIEHCHHSSVRYLTPSPSSSPNGSAFSWFSARPSRQEERRRFSSEDASCEPLCFSLGASTSRFFSRSLASDAALRVGDLDSGDAIALVVEVGEYSVSSGFSRRPGNRRSHNGSRQPEPRAFSGTSRDFN